MLSVKHNTARYNHNGINQRYIAEILPLFTNFPNLQQEIERKSKEGYTIVGYKGTNKQIADSFITQGVSMNFSAGDISGSARGDGVYITTSFDAAKEFSELTVRREMAYQGGKEDLRTPPEPPNFFELSRQQQEKYIFAWESHIKYCENFYHSRECKENMVFLIFFVKEFFNFRRVSLREQETYTAGYEEYDYIEGPIPGHGAWEIKFNKNAAIYAKICMLCIPYLDLKETPLPNLPNGTQAMLHMVYPEQMTVETREPTGVIKHNLC